MHQADNSFVPVLVSVLAAVAASAPATAEITHAEWSSDQDFYFHVNYMPDLDQDRSGLPGNGSMFCVPTATMNLFAYAAEWGLDDMPPGPGVWQGDVGYNTMTNHLDDLGELMDTGTDGTGHGAWWDGTGEWIDGFPLNRHKYYKTDSWCPNLSDAAKKASYGSILAVVYGRYNFNPGPQPIIGSRTGGHCVTVTHMRSTGTNHHELSVRDPGDGGSIFSEAPWALKVYDDVETRSVLQDWDDNSAYHPADVTVINYDPDDDLIRFIDKVYMLRPSSSFDWQTVELNIEPLTNDLQWGQPQTHSFQPLETFYFADVEEHPDTYAFLTLQTRGGEQPRLVALDKISGDATTLATWPRATDFVVGRHREMYVLAGAEVHRTDLEGRILATAALPAPAQAIACRDATDEVIVISTTARNMTVFPRSLGVDGERVRQYALPTAIPPSPAPSIGVCEETGAVAILVPEQNLLVHLVAVVEPGGPLDHQVLPLPEPGRNVAFDDRDHMLVATQSSKVLGYESDDNGAWAPAEEPWYERLRPAGRFNVTRGRTNYDPAINADDDVDIPSEELAELGTSVLDCPGDVDINGVVDFADLIALLAAWGPCAGCPEDIDGSGTVDFGDVIDLLGGWGPCVIE